MSNESILASLEHLAKRQREAFIYSIGSDGLPVWNEPSTPDAYTYESYAREQHAPDNERD
jgi:hypothetical protein